MQAWLPLPRRPWRVTALPAPRHSTREPLRGRPGAGQHQTLGQSPLAPTWTWMARGPRRVAGGVHGPERGARTRAEVFRKQPQCRGWWGRRQAPQGSREGRSWQGTTPHSPRALTAENGVGVGRGSTALSQASEDEGPLATTARPPKPAPLGRCSHNRPGANSRGPELRRRLTRDSTVGRA